MKLRKVMSMLLALALMLTMAVSVSAEGETITFVTSAESIYENDLFTLSLRINGTGITEIKGAQVCFTYDATKIVPVNAEGNELTSFDAAIWAEAIPSTHMIMNPSLTKADGVGTITVVMGRNYGATSIPVTDGEIDVFNFNFKALAKGDVPLTLGTAIQSYFSTDAATVVPTYVEKTITVQEKPDAPSITDYSISGDLNDEKTVTAAYTFKNGNKSGNMTDGDASEIVWYVGGEKVKESTADVDKTLTLDETMVGKTVKYEVTPKVNRAEILNPTGAMVTSAESAVVMPKIGYVPTAEVVLPEELIATLEYTVEVDLDDTYAVATDATTYVWYVADAADADVSTLTPLENTTATASFGADLRDKYAIVVVTPAVTVNGTNFPAPAVTKTALIKGEPPVVDASAVKVDKEINVKKAIKVVEGKDFTAESKSPTSDELTIEYAWYLATAEEFAEFDPTGKEAVSVKNSFTPAKEDLGKFVVLYITATDDLGIATTAEVKYTLPIAEATGSAPAASSSPSLVAGKDDEGEKEPEVVEPGTEPGTTEPTTDPAGTANDKGAAAFTDVDKEAYAWAYDSIDVLAKAGVIKGMSETTFEPEATATNAQVIALVVRIAGLAAEDATTDKVDAEHWVAAELAVADAKGILGVYGDKVATEEAITREVAFTLLYNAIKAAGVELKEDAEAIEYSDAASIDAACAEAITALTKAGIVNGMGDGTLAPKATITRAQLAKILGMANGLLAK